MEKGMEKGDWYLPMLPEEQYYTDFVCSMFLKSFIKKHYPEQDLDRDQIISLLTQYFSPNNKDIEYLKKKNDEKKKRDDIRRKQCFECVYYDNCRKERIENCSTFIPK